MINGWLAGLFRRKQVAKIVTQVAIRNRVTGAVIFTAEVEVDEDADRALKLGLAVKAAHKAKADLRNADLPNANLHCTDLGEINLHGADLSSANLRHAILWIANLSNAILESASLYTSTLWRADLRNADLRNADLQLANLREADLRDADLRGADLRDATLCNTDLRGADLRDADLRHADLEGSDLRHANFGNVPVIADIHATVYAAASQTGALDMYDWHHHAFRTTHSHAGWVVVLAGAAGLALEERIGTPAAAAAIYLASDPERWQTERLPDFYGNDNDEALADMKRLAGVQAASPEHGRDKG